MMRERDQDRLLEAGAIIAALAGAALSVYFLFY
jgi:hypothetical protein